MGGQIFLANQDKIGLPPRDNSYFDAYLFNRDSPVSAEFFKNVNKVNACWFQE